MIGAAALAATSALRSGAGYVTAACPAGERPVLATKVTSAMTLGLPETPDGTVAHSALDVLSPRLETFDCLALGPGLGRHPETRQFVLDLVPLISLPAVIDADALVALGSDPERIRGKPIPPVLTPHPGELAALLSTSKQQVLRDRESIARETARRLQVVLLLKGHRTIITDGTRLQINSTGNPGMATAGSGDVLTGILAGILAQGYEPYEAAVLAAWVHGRAGDRVAARLGQTGLISEDLVGEIPFAFAEADGPHLPGRR
jgi:NAD(P)H-hydrate epimerase